MDVLTVLWPILFGGLVTPLTTWVKGMVPANLPLTPEFISLVLAGIIIIPLKLWLAPAAPWIEIMAVMLGADKISQVLHERTKK